MDSNDLWKTTLPYAGKAQPLHRAKPARFESFRECSDMPSCCVWPTPTFKPRGEMESPEHGDRLLTYKEDECVDVVAQGSRHLGW
jgi:hypothetical protein